MKTQKADDSLFSEESLVLQTVEDLPDPQRMRYLKEKLSSFAEKLCLKARLSDLHTSLTHSHSTLAQLLCEGNRNQEITMKEVLQAPQSSARIVNLNTHWTQLQNVEALALQVKDSIQQLATRQKAKDELFASDEPAYLNFTQGKSEEKGMRFQFEQSRNFYSELERTEKELEQLRKENSEMTKTIVTQEQELNSLREDAAKMEARLSSKDRDLLSLENAIKRKKEYEALVIKASQEIKRKEEESQEKNQALAKAQTVIVRLNEELQRLLTHHQQVESEQVSKLQTDITHWRSVYDNLMAEYRSLERKLLTKDLELKSLEESSESKVQQVKKQAEDVIRYLKHEVIRLKHEGENTNLYFSGEGMKRSRSQARFGTELQRQGSPSRSISQSKMILQTTPKNPTSTKADRADSSHKRGVTFASDLPPQAAVPSNPYEHKKSQILLDAYEKALNELYVVRLQLKEVGEEQAVKLSKITDSNEDLLREYLDRVEQYLNREQNLLKQLEKRNKEVKELQFVNLQMKSNIESLLKHQQELLAHHSAKEVFWKSLEEEKDLEIQSLTTYFKTTLGDLRSDFLTKIQIIQDCQKQIQHKESECTALQSTIQELEGKNDRYQEEIERVYAQLDEAIQAKSSSLYQVERLSELIKDIWQSNYDSHYQGQISSNDLPSEMLKGLQDLIKGLKLQKQTQKDEYYELLQQISEASECKSGLNALKEHTENIASLSNASLARSSASLKPKKVVSRKHELYNMLRDEIKRMHAELVQRQETILHLKKQVELNEKAYKQKHCDLESMIKDNQALKLSLQDLQTLLDQEKKASHEFQYTISEKEATLDELKQSIEMFERELVSLTQQMDDIMNENYELRQQQVEWQNAYKELEGQVHEINQDRSTLAENFGGIEEKLKSKISKLKSKLTEKEQTLFDIRIALEREMRHRQDYENEQEIKKYNARSVSVNTDDIFQDIESENAAIRQELIQVRHDITVVLDSYDTLRVDNERLHDTIKELKEDMGRVLIEKQQVESLLDQEREFLERVRKVEKSYTKLIGEPDTNDSEIDQQDLPSSELPLDFSSVKKHSNSQARLGASLYKNYETNVQRHSFHGRQDLQISESQKYIEQPQMMYSSVIQQVTPSSSQQKLRRGSNGTRNSKSNHNLNIPIDQIRNSQQSKGQPSSSSRRLTLDVCTDKDNAAIQYGQANGDQSLYKKKVRKLLKHFEAVLSHLQIEISGQKSQDQHRPPLLTRNHSHSKGLKSPPTGEVLFYQAQSYFYKKSPHVYNKIQALMNGPVKVSSEKQAQLGWVFVQMTRKLAAACLEGAIVVNNEQFTETLRNSQDFLQQELGAILENEESLMKVHDSMLDSVSQLIQASCNILLKGPSLQTPQIRDCNELSHSFIFTTATPSKALQFQDVSILDKVTQVEARLKEKLGHISAIHQFMQRSSLVNVAQLQRQIAPEAMWKLINCMHRFTSCLKLELNFDCLTVGQISKQLPRPQSYQPVIELGNQCSINGDSLKLISDEFQSIDLDKSSSKADVILQSLKKIATAYDKKFNTLNEKVVPTYISRLLLKIRKEVSLAQQSPLRKLAYAIQELDANLKELTSSSKTLDYYTDRDSAAGDEALLMILKENLELRSQVEEALRTS